MADIGLPTAYDAQGNAVGGSPDDLSGLIKSGQAGFMKSDSVTLLSPSGQPVQIAGAEVPNALDQGFSLPSSQWFTTENERSKYGTGIGNELKAGAAAAARGLTLGVSDAALTQFGVASPETLEGLKKYNPDTSFLSEMAGNIAPALLTGGESAVAKAAAMTPAGLAARGGAAVTSGLEKALGVEAAETVAGKIAKSAIAHGVGSAVEGAAFGAGQGLSESVLGDPDHVGENILAGAGMGAMIGGGLGTGFGVVGGGIKSILGARASKAMTEAANHDVAVEKVMNPAPENVNMPGSISEMEKKLADTQWAGFDASEITPAPRLREALHIVGPLEHPLIPEQIQAIESKPAFDKYRALKETEAGQTLSQWEAAQKRELKGRLDYETAQLSPQKYVTSDPVKAGNELLDEFKTSYEATKKAEGKIFNQFDDIAPNVRVSPADVIPKMAEAVPEISTMTRLTEDGALEIRPYSAKMGVSKNVYDGVKELFNGVSEGASVAELRHLRNTLGDRINILAAPRDAAMLGRLKKSMLDLIEDQFEKHAPNSGIREAFKNYAINEGERELLEKTLGGTFNDKASILKQIKAEEVGDKIFRNTNTIAAAKAVLAPDVYDKLLANYIAENIEKYTDRAANGFSSRKFASWLKRDEVALRSAMEHKPNLYEKLSALTDIMKILPDAPPVNPSGTAKTAFNLAEILSHGATGVPGKVAEILKAKVESSETKAALDASLAAAKEGRALEERARTYSVMKKFEEMNKSVSKKISEGIDYFFNKGGMKKLESIAVPATIQSINTGKKSEKHTFHQIHDQVSKFAANPSGYIDHISEVTSQIQNIAPKIADALTNTTTQGLQFLAQRLPQNPHYGDMLNAHVVKWEPSDTEKAQFMRYARAVTNPMTVFADMANNRLTHEAVESLKTVYPKMYNQAVSHIAEKLSEVEKQIPFQKRIQLSTFLGMPVDQMTQPKFAGDMQAAHEFSQYKETGGMNMGGVSKMSKSNSVMTDTQRTLTRS